jgi:hypothetical protein
LESALTLDCSKKKNDVRAFWASDAVNGSRGRALYSLDLNSRASLEYVDDAVESQFRWPVECADGSFTRLVLTALVLVHGCGSGIATAAAGGSSSSPGAAW